MPDRAAIVTGASRGIGLALAETLAAEGYGLTISARKPDTLEAAAERLRAAAARWRPCRRTSRTPTRSPAVVARHKERFGRLDVLVNNAGVGIGAAATDHQAKHVDLQLGVNVRAIVLLYRESIEMLRAAGGEHGNALVVNLASLAGKSPQPWLSVYSATKAAVVGYTQRDEQGAQRRRREVGRVLPGFVDTDMSEFVKGTVPAEEMLRVSDMAEALRFLLRALALVRRP